MATMKTIRTNNSPFRAGHERMYEPGDPIPCPDAIEDDSDTAWASWDRANMGIGWDDTDTQPMPLS